MEDIIILLALLLVDLRPLKRKPLTCNSAGILYFCASAVYQRVYPCSGIAKRTSECVHRQFQNAICSMKVYEAKINGTKI